jgi:hypothetical protein
MWIGGLVDWWIGQIWKKLHHGFRCCLAGVRMCACVGLMAGWLADQLVIH